ncbi:MAG: ATP-grasp domain-containing protein [Bacillota bacterium]|nr:ATP-grasp domain-containing protein [Bacillota bacterium]
MRVGVLTLDPEEARTTRPARPGKGGTELERARSIAQQDATTAAISRILAEAGHEVVEIPVDDQFMERLRTVDIDIVFNTYAGAAGRASQFQVCAVMDLVGVRYTGSAAQVHALGLAKHTTKKVLRHDGLPTPAFQTFHRPQTPLDPALRFPLIVKPAQEGSSVGISEDSVVDDERALRRVLDRTLAAYGGPVLAEEFIEGREFTVGVLGNRPPRALPVVEVDFASAGRGTRGFYSHELKSQDVVGTGCPASIREALAEEIQRLAVGAFQALECSDCARVDFRVDGQGRPHILELNTLPGMKEGYSDFPKAAAVAGYSYERLVLTLLELAVERHGLAAH